MGDASLSERKTLAQFQREAESNSHGWACPRCGCKRTRVVKTWANNDGAVRRKRVCDNENCGQGYTHTTEVPCPPGLKVVVDDQEEPERACA